MSRVFGPQPQTGVRLHDPLDQPLPILARIADSDQRLGAPTYEEITDVARWTHERLAQVLARHGRSLDMLEGDDEAADGLVHEQPVLASCYGASAADQQLLGDAPGQQTRKLAHAVREVAELESNDTLAEVGGVNVHAGAAVPSRDRQRLERLCRYVARPTAPGDPTALEGLAKRPARHPWAWLLQRVFVVDIMTCPRCRGAMRLVKIANKPDEIARVLADLGLGARPPPRPRPPPKGQLELDLAA